MRILSVSAQKPDSTGSGVYLAQTTAAFMRAGHSAAIIAGIDAQDDPAVPQGAEFYAVRFNTESLPFNVCGMSDVMPYASTRYRDLTPAMTEQFTRAFGSVLLKAITEFKPDLIVCHHLYLTMALTVEAVHELGYQCKVTALCHSTDLRQMNSHNLERDRILHAAKQLSRIYSLHKAQASQIASLYGIDPQKVSIVGTGYDSSVFKQPALTGPHAPLAPSKTGFARELCYVGKISRAKGVMSLIRALKKLSFGPQDLRLRLIGGSSSPKEEQEARELAKTAPCTVEFCGRIPTADLVSIYCESHVFVLPSFYEGLPLVILEALACGCHIVSSNLPGLGEWEAIHLPGASVRLVNLPRMQQGTTDVPNPQDLPRFEQDLAEAIQTACGDYLQEGRLSVDTSSLSWDGVASRIVKDY